jgi:hypothetical protein
LWGNLNRIFQTHDQNLAVLTWIIRNYAASPLVFYNITPQVSGHPDTFDILLNILAPNHNEEASTNPRNVD